MTEDQMQAAQVIWFRNTYPEYRRCLWAVPNGGGRSAYDAAVLQATGVLAGVFDLHLYINKQLYIFENKVGNNQLTRDTVRNGKKCYGQLEWMQIMQEQGAIAYVIRSVEEFKQAIFTIMRTLKPPT